MKPRGHSLWTCSVLALASAAQAAETVTYSYDALGRLTATTSSGGPNSGVATGIAYDPAGNRSSYSVAGGSAGTLSPPPSTPSPPPSTPSPPPSTPSPPPSTPPPPPPPGNSAPTAVDDSGTQSKCSTKAYAVLQNDSDADGDPLSLVSVDGPNFSLYSPTSVAFQSGASAGTKAGTYTVRDSHGAAATATLSVNVAGGFCQNYAPPPLTRGGGGS